MTLARILSLGQVNAILLRYPNKSKWTREHDDWLRRQRLERFEVQMALEFNLELAQTLEELLKRIEGKNQASRR